MELGEEQVAEGKADDKAADDGQVDAHPKVVGGVEGEGGEEQAQEAVLEEVHPSSLAEAGGHAVSAQGRRGWARCVRLVPMGRAILIIGGAALLVAVWLYAVLDAAQADRGRVRTLPKGAWLAVTVLFPVVGSVLWFWLGRPRADRFGSFGAPASRPVVAPDDDPEFLKFLEARARREQADRDRQATRDDQADRGQGSQGQGSQKQSSQEQGPAGGGSQAEGPDSDAPSGDTAP